MLPIIINTGQMSGGSTQLFSSSEAFALFSVSLSVTRPNDNGPMMSHLISFHSFGNSCHIPHQTHSQYP